MKNLLEHTNLDEIEAKDKLNSLSPNKAPEPDTEDTKLRVGKQ